MAAETIFQHLTPVDTYDDFEVNCRDAHKTYAQIVKGLSESQRMEALNQYSSKTEDNWRKVVLALLYNILKEPSSQEESFKLLCYLERDKTFLISQLVTFCGNKWPRLIPEVKIQILWLFKKLIIIGSDTSVVSFHYIRLITFYPEINAEHVEFVKTIVFSLEMKFLEQNDIVLSYLLYAVLRLIPEHKMAISLNPNDRELQNLCNNEISFVKHVIYEYWPQYSKCIGLELLRAMWLCQYSVPEFKPIWADLVALPSKICGPKGIGEFVRVCMQKPQNKSFLMLRITTKLENKLSFTLTKLPSNGTEYRRYFEWLHDHYLHRTTSLELRGDIIRHVSFVMSNIPKEVIFAKDPPMLQRWFFLKWLVSNVMVPGKSSDFLLQHTSFSLFFDWLFWQEKENAGVMLLEPAVLLLYNNAISQNIKHTEHLLKCLLLFCQTMLPNLQTFLFENAQQAFLTCLRYRVILTIAPVIAQSSYPVKLSVMLKDKWPLLFAAQKPTQPAVSDQPAVAGSDERFSDDENSDSAIENSEESNNREELKPSPAPTPAVKPTEVKVNQPVSSGVPSPLIPEAAASMPFVGRSEVLLSLVDFERPRIDVEKELANIERLGGKALVQKCLNFANVVGGDPEESSSGVTALLAAAFNREENTISEADLSELSEALARFVTIHLHPHLLRPVEQNKGCVGPVDALLNHLMIMARVDQTGDDDTRSDLFWEFVADINELSRGAHLFRHLLARLHNEVFHCDVPGGAAPLRSRSAKEENLRFASDVVMEFVLHCADSSVDGQTRQLDEDAVDGVDVVDARANDDEATRQQKWLSLVRLVTECDVELVAKSLPLLMAGAGVGQWLDEKPDEVPTSPSFKLRWRLATLVCQSLTPSAMAALEDAWHVVAREGLECVQLVPSVGFAARLLTAPKLSTVDRLFVWDVIDASLRLFSTQTFSREALFVKQLAKTVEVFNTKRKGVTPVDMLLDRGLKQRISYSQPTKPVLQEMHRVREALDAYNKESGQESGRADKATKDVVTAEHFLTDVLLMWTKMPTGAGAPAAQPHALAKLIEKEAFAAVQSAKETTSLDPIKNHLNVINTIRRSVTDASEGHVSLFFFQNPVQNALQCLANSTNKRHRNNTYADVFNYLLNEDADGRRKGSKSSLREEDRAVGRPSILPQQRSMPPTSEAVTGKKRRLNQDATTNQPLTKSRSVTEAKQSTSIVYIDDSDSD